MQPKLKIGILTHPEISLTLKGQFRDRLSGALLNAGHYVASVSNQLVTLKFGDTRIEGGTLMLEAQSSDDTFILHNVKIGIQFHWEREEDQEFCGNLELVIDNNNLVAINHAPIEKYLTSVISSEMSATSSPELLKAHAVISRSWVMAQIEKNKSLKQAPLQYQSCVRTDDELVRWYDREDHILYDVCADDHCQRYQGIGRVTNPAVQKAIEQTTGLVLTSEGAICDARFSKCCGGVSELFENCWEPVHHPYLQAVRDDVEDKKPDLTTEKDAYQWIMSSPDAFCNSNDVDVLGQVLNNYDQETNHFFRWKVTYTQSELSQLVRERSGLDFGDIQQLIPLERGVSGRIIRLKIVGSRKTYVIGKELEIRKTLSSSHLFSSAFVVEKQQNETETRFVLHGAGWGHGVGLCQIGAAVMGSQGFTYEQILNHYFKGASLTKKYES